MNSFANLGFAIVVFGAAVFWAAERPAVAQGGDVLDSNLAAYQPSKLVQITNPHDAADASVLEDDSRDRSDDPSVDGPMPPF